MNTHTNHRILVIDDSRAIHDDFRKILCPAGNTIDGAASEFFGETSPAPTTAQPTFEIDSAYQGEEGVTAVRCAIEQGRPYAMAFLDVRMPPGMDGVETAERLWQICPNLQIVICSAYSDYSWEEMVHRLGRREQMLVLKKPFASIEALQLACALCDKWKLTQESRNRLAETERVVEERTRELREANERLHAEMEQRKEAEAHLLRAQRLESVGTLASGIAHDLNNMLGPILMGTELLRSIITEPNAEIIVDTIEENATRAAGIVKQVLIFARGAEGEHSPLDVSHLVRELKTTMDQTFPKSIIIKVAQQKSLALVDGDANQLHQVLLNLCVNARDAMEDGGTLTVVVENADIDENYAGMTPDARAGHFVMIRVGDTGCGIPREVIDKIYEPFFTTKPVGKGTGLGLSTVAGIVRGHGGFINVSSHLGKGTVFEVYLPVCIGDVALDVVPAPNTAQRGNGELVLVVDDENTVCEVTMATLRDHGYQALAAADGAEALSIYAARQHEIQAVLTDVRMPFVDGVALCRALRKINPVVNLIASSGDEAQPRRQELISLGVHTILTKPFGSEMLLDALQQVLCREGSEACLA